GQGVISIAAYAAQSSENASSDQFISAVGLYQSGAYESAIACLHELITHTRETSIEHLEILRLLAFCNQASGDLAGAERCARTIQAFADRQGLSVWSGHALAQLAAISRDKGHAGYGADLSLRAKTILRESGDFIGLSRACYELGYCFLQQGKLAEARAELETAITLANISYDPLTEALAAR